MKTKYSLALSAALSLLPLNLSTSEPQNKTEYTIFVKNWVSSQAKAKKWREDIMKTSLSEFRAEEYTEKNAKGEKVYGTVLRGLSSSSKEELDKRVNTDASAFAEIYTKEDITNIGEVRAEFAGVMDAFLNGDKERFCNYIGEEIYVKRGRIMSKEEYCSKIVIKKMTKCKDRGVNLDGLISRKNTSALPAYALMKRVEKNDFVKEGDYAIISRPSDMCLEEIGFLFRKENGFWRIVSIGG